MSNLPPLTYPNIQATFKKVVDYLENHGVFGNNIRIIRYKKFVDWIDQGCIENIYEQLEIIQLWRELHEIIFVFETLIINKIELPIELVKKAFSGNPIPTGNPEKDKSRNYMLELRATIYFLRLGYKVKLTDDCDVIAENQKNVFFIECKRLYSVSKVDKRIDKAYKQLEKRFSSSDTRKKKKGIIWLDPSPIMLKDVFIYTAYSRTGARQAARYDLQEFSMRHITNRNKYTDKRIFALILQMVMPSYTGSVDGITTGFISMIYPINKNIGFFGMFKVKQLLNGLFEIEELE